MKPVDQTILTYEPGKVYGNCFQAAIASVLELPLEEVPHFADGCEAGESTGVWFDRMVPWLKPHGLAYFEIGAEGTDERIKRALGYHLILGKSPRGDWTHVVVGLGGEMVHDPHPARNGLLAVEMFGVFVSRCGA